MKTILKTKIYIQSLLNAPSLNYIKLLSSITLVLFGFVFIITKLPLNISYLLVVCVITTVLVSFCWDGFKLSPNLFFKAIQIVTLFFLSSIFWFNLFINLVLTGIIKFSSKSNNFIYSIDEFKNIYSQIIENINNFQDYFNSFDVYHQFYLYNIMFTTTLLMSLFFYISGLYANYLLDKLDLQNRIPILARLLRYRLQYQKYYFWYLFITTLFLLIINLVLNIALLNL